MTWPAPIDRTKSTFLVLQTPRTPRTRATHFRRRSTPAHVRARSARGEPLRRLGAGQRLAEKRCARIADALLHRVRVVIRGGSGRLGALRLRLRRIAGLFALQASLLARLVQPTRLRLLGLGHHEPPFAEEEASLYARSQT